MLANKSWIRLSTQLVLILCIDVADKALLIAVVSWFLSALAGLLVAKSTMLGVLSAQAMCTGPVSEPITISTESIRALRASNGRRLGKIFGWLVWH